MIKLNLLDFGRKILIGLVDLSLIFVTVFFKLVFAFSNVLDSCLKGLVLLLMLFACNFCVFSLSFLLTSGQKSSN